MRSEVVPHAKLCRSFPTGLRRSAAAALCAALGALAAGCSGGSSHYGGTSDSRDVRLSITPGDGSSNTPPNRGITVTATGGRITKVAVNSGGEPVKGTLSAGGTVWHSAWALNVSQHYTVTATATGPSGRPVTRTSSFRTLTPKSTFRATITEGSDQPYGVGMPIILYFSRPIVYKAAVERALQIKTSKPVVGSWYWDDQCGMAPVCLYFRPKRYWPTHTKVNFTGHLDGVQVAPGVYGNHTLSQAFTIGSALTVVVSTSGHYMNVFRDGKQFAHWPISSGRPGDETPNGNYLTIEKQNPADMVGPGYNIEVPWSVRFTWSGDYLHDAYWSVGDQGFDNVSHGCVNMSPANAETYYKMAVPGDPVKITGSLKTGGWDSGWTMWFLPWKQWLRGSATHKVVLTGPRGSTLLSPSSPAASGPTNLLGPASSRRVAL